MSFVAGVMKATSHVFMLFPNPTMWSAWAWVTTLIGLFSSWASHATCFPRSTAPVLDTVAFCCMFLPRVFCGLCV